MCSAVREWLSGLMISERSLPDIACLLFPSMRAFFLPMMMVGGRRKASMVGAENNRQGETHV